MCNKFAPRAAYVMVCTANDLRHKFWFAIIIIASLPAHGRYCNIDVVDRSGLRHALYSGWRFARGDGLFGTCFVDCECSN